MSELQEAIVQMALTTKLSGRQIGEELGCSGVYVNEILKREGIERGRRIDWESWEDVITKMVEDGYSQVEIARYIGCDVSTLHYHLVRLDLLRRKCRNAVQCRIEIGKEEFNGKTYNDVTDIMIERPCIIKTDPPKWKLDLEEQFWDTKGKFGVNFGYLRMGCR